MIPRADDYATVYARFRWNVPERYNMAHDACDRHAADPGRVALVVEGEAGGTREWTFHRIRQLANRCANLLEACGVEPGDRVAILLGQAVETAVANLACFKCGAVSMPLFTKFGLEDLEFRLRRRRGAGARHGHRELRPRRTGARPSSPPRDGVHGGRGDGRRARLLAGARARFRALRDAGHPRRGPGRAPLYLGHHRLAEGGPPRAAHPPRPHPGNGLREQLPRPGRRPPLVAGGLGLDRGALRHPHARVVLRPSGDRGAAAGLRPGRGPRHPRPPRGPQHPPAPHHAQAHGPGAGRAARRRPSLRLHRGRAGRRRRHGVGGGDAGGGGQRDLRPDRVQPGGGGLLDAPRTPAGGDRGPDPRARGRRGGRRRGARGAGGNRAHRRPAARSGGDALVLAAPGGERGEDRERLAPHRRRRPQGRGRLPVVHRAGGRRHHLRRRAVRARGDRGVPDRPSGRGARGRDRGSGPFAGRGGEGVRGGPRGVLGGERARGRAPRPRPAGPARARGTPGDRVRREPPAHDDREDHAPRAAAAGGGPAARADARAPTAASATA